MNLSCSFSGKGKRPGGKGQGKGLAVVIKEKAAENTAA